MSRFAHNCLLLFRGCAAQDGTLLVNAQHHRCIILRTDDIRMVCFKRSVFLCFHNYNLPSIKFTIFIIIVTKHLIDGSDVIIRKEVGGQLQLEGKVKRIPRVVDVACVSELTHILLFQVLELCHLSVGNRHFINGFIHQDFRLTYTSLNVSAIRKNEVISIRHRPTIICAQEIHA